MSTATPTTAELVEHAQSVLTAAEQARTDHLADRAAAATDLAAMQAKPLEVTDDEMARGEARVKRLDLGTPPFDEAITDARAELRYALGAHHSATLPDKINPDALSASIDAERDKVAASLRKITRLVEAWNSLIGSTVRQCREVDLVEGACDPFAPIYATRQGSLVVHGEERSGYNVAPTVQVRTDQALAAAGYARFTVTTR